MRSENFLLVAITAAKFGCRPSRLAGLHDPVLALDFDLAAAARLLEHERAALDTARAELPPGDVAPGFSPADRPEGRLYEAAPSTREEHW